MGNIVYIKKMGTYNEVLKEKHYHIPIFFKKIIYMYKNIFNLITKKEIENINLWILPIQDRYTNNKIIKYVKKLFSFLENTYVISNDLENNDIYNLLDKYNVKYLKGYEIKKYLIIKILEYINNIQNKEMSDIEITILANDISEFNVYLIEKLSKIAKSLKIVSKNIYKFKNIEEKLYNEYGIAIQFSNSYKKSLEKSKIIINLDFLPIDINEYKISSKAIIINCVEENLKIKSKLYNGIVINRFDIKFKKELKDKFKKINIYDNYDSIVLYESIIGNEKNIDRIFKKIEEDKVIVKNLIGNNGIINKKEFKNIFKKLDK